MEIFGYNRENPLRKGKYNEKTWIVWILGLCLLARLLPGLAVETQAVTAGTCGNDLTWVLNSEGTLTITGKGAIPDYTARSPAPWCGNIYDSVKAVEISRGVTQIGDYAFYKLSKLASITIPNSVNEIGENVFEDCRSLESVTIPEGVTRIAWHAFYNCRSLVDVTLPESVTYLYSNAFYRCGNLKDVYYAGNETQWNAIVIGGENEHLIDATIHYNSTFPEESEPPAEDSEPTMPPAQDDTPVSNPFADVAEEAYYFEPVLWAVNKGITNGMDAPCTRGQIVTFLYRAMT